MDCFLWFEEDLRLDPIGSSRAGDIEDDQRSNVVCSGWCAARDCVHAIERNSARDVCGLFFLLSKELVGSFAMHAAISMVGIEVREPGTIEVIAPARVFTAADDFQGLSGNKPTLRQAHGVDCFRVTGTVDVNPGIGKFPTHDVELREVGLVLQLLNVLIDIAEFQADREGKPNPVPFGLIVPSLNEITDVFLRYRIVRGGGDQEYFWQLMRVEIGSPPFQQRNEGA